MDIGILIGTLVFFLGILLGLPLCWGFLLTSFIILFLLDSPLLFVAGTYFHALNSYILMAVSFFIAAGSLMASAGIAENLVRFSYIIVGKIKGGMVSVGILTTCFFGALTGSAAPSISALVPLLVFPMERYGYDRSYTTAALCASSFLGYLIPPSVPCLIYSLVAHQSVAAMFLATLIPGIMITIGYLILNYFICDNYIDSDKAAKEKVKLLTRKEKIKSLLGSLPALGCPLLVLGGIYGGLCTPNEAGALAVVYTLLVGMFVYRKLDRKTLWAATYSSLISIGMIFVLIAVGTVLARTLARAGVVELFTNSLISLFQNKYLILLTINIILLILGMFIDGIPILIIVVPLIVPLVQEINVNLIHLGAIIVLNIGVGVITPPYALSIFVGTRLSGVPYEKLVKPMMAFLFFVALPVLFLVTYIPGLSCWLPTLILGSKIVGSW